MTTQLVLESVVPIKNRPHGGKTGNNLEFCDTSSLLCFYCFVANYIKVYFMRVRE